MQKVLIFCLLALSLAPAQQKQRIAVLPSVGELEPERLNNLTDKVREIANKILPMDNFLLLRQDAVIDMIGTENYFIACKEGTCIGELAKKANANYGARCDIFKVNGNFAIKFELYSVKDEAILEIFTEYNINDFFGMLAVLEERLPGAFRKVLSISSRTDSSVSSPSVQSNAGDVEMAKIQEPETKSTFKDSREGKEYKTIKIGNQTWMAENLNYNASGSKCYDNKTANCDKYGRLYDWNTAMKACPKGWHLPSDVEWEILETAVGGSKTAGKHLKAINGWNNNGNGLDSYGFAAMPGGSYYSSGNFINLGNRGYWWNASEYNDSYASCLNIDYYGENLYTYVYNKSNLFSVRCLQDY